MINLFRIAREIFRLKIFHNIPWRKANLPISRIACMSRIDRYPSFGAFPLPSLFVLPITLIFLSTSIHLTPLQEIGVSISKERITLAATSSGLLATESSWNRKVAACASWRNWGCHYWRDRPHWELIRKYLPRLILFRLFYKESNAMKGNFHAYSLFYALK